MDVGGLRRAVVSPAGGSAAASTITSASASAPPVGPSAAAPAGEPTGAPSAAASVARTPLPTLDDWRDAPLASVPGATDLGCETKRVAEWFRMQCRGNEDAGVPMDLRFITSTPPGTEVNRGRVDADLPAFVRLVVPVLPGTHVEAEVTFSHEGHRLVIDRPGAELPEPFARFEGLAIRPGDDAYVPARIVGASQMGCRARVADGWARIRCDAAAGLSPKSAELSRGFVKGSTKVVVAPGQAIDITTPFEAGSDVRVEMSWQSESRALDLAWAAGAKRPKTIGRFQGFDADKPDEEEFKAAPMIALDGSRELRCQLKRVETWLQLVCIGTSVFGRPAGIDEVAGVRKEDVTSYASDGIMTLTAKLEPGTPFGCRLKWSGGERRLLVDWQKDAPAPEPFGRFDPPVADAG